MEIMHKKIWDQRQKMGGINASRENNQAIAKQIQILENRLDKALKRYNEALANNKRLRENIDNLRRERLVFDQIYKKLEKVRPRHQPPRPARHASYAWLACARLRVPACTGCACLTALAWLRVPAPSGDCRAARDAVAVGPPAILGVAERRSSLTRRRRWHEI